MLVGQLLLFIFHTSLSIIPGFLLYKTFRGHQQIFSKQTWYIWLNLLTGLFFASMFWWWNKYQQWDLQFFVLTTWAISFGFVLIKLIKSYRQRYFLLVAFAVFCWGLLILKFTFDWNWYGKLPLNICNYVQVFIMFRPLYCLIKKHQRIISIIDNYLLCFGLLGALAYTVAGMVYGQNLTTAVQYEAIMIHIAYYPYCIYCLFTKTIVANKKDALLNMIWVSCLFCVFVFTNQIWNNYHLFTRYFDDPVFGSNPLNPIYNWLKPTCFMIGKFEINLIYYVIVLGAASAVLYFFVDLLMWIQRKIKPTLLIQ